LQILFSPYAKFSTAYISGGKIANVTFNPSTAKSWEAGVKSDLLDRRLRFNLALFTVKYNDVQILTTPLSVAPASLVYRSVQHNASSMAAIPGRAVSSSKPRSCLSPE